MSQQQDALDIKWFRIMKQVWQEADKNEPEIVQFHRMMIPLVKLVMRRNGRGRSPILAKEAYCG